MLNFDFDEAIREMTGESANEALGRREPIVINAASKDLVGTAEKSWEALRRSNTPARLFRYSSGLVRVERDEQGVMLTRDLTENRLRFELARAASWVELNKKSPTPSAPPLSVVRDLLARPEPPLPVLNRIVTAPFFTRDGELVMQPGYHAGARVYYDSTDLTLPALPNKPSADDLAQARRLIERELLADFSFSRQSDLAHAYALMILPAVREMIDGFTPLHDVEAPIAGSGKGLLADVLTYPTLGEHPGVIGEVTNEDEWRKSITAILMRGHDHLFIDNVRRPVTSATLARAITAPEWIDRILGVSRTFQIPMRAVWIMTANNPSFSDEMARRMIRVRIDPGCEHPEERRNFKHLDLRVWVAENRARLLWAVLVLVLNWIARGRPNGSVSPLGSFESWSKIIGGILETAGVSGFLENRLDAVAVADGETAAWQQLVAEWYVAHGQNEVFAKELLPLAREIDGIYLGKSDKSERAQQTAFGIAIRARRDRVFTISIADKTDVTVRIQHAGEFKRVAKWRLAVLNPGVPS